MTAYKEASSDPIHLSDHDLMESMAQKEAGALEQLMARHFKSMISIAYRFLGNRAEAEEVTQESFLRLWQRAPQWDKDGTASVRTWLARVVTNLSIDIYRKHKASPLEGYEAIEDKEDQAPDGFDQSAEQGNQALVRDLLKTLPERQRLVIIFSYFEDLSDSETAEVMDLTVGAVESLLVRARKNLKQEIAKRGLDGREVL